MKILRSLTFLAVLAAALPAYPQSAESVVAVVNDDIITKQDLEHRMKLALVSSNIGDTEDMRSNMRASVLRRMIDEDLKVQAAIKAKVSVTTGEIAAQMNSIEQQNHLPAGGLAKFLAGKGVEIDALRQQVRAEIAWAKLVQQVLIRRVHVSDNAVSSRLDAIRANLGKPEYHAAEIYLGLDDAKDEPEVRDLANRLSEQMSKGAPFTAIARQFNQAGSPDGDLGWVSEGMLDESLLAALDKLKPNEVTPPIRTEDGYHILTLLERRKVGEGIGGGGTVDLLVIDLNSMASAGQAERGSQLQRLREAVAPARSCDDLTRLSRQVPSASLSTLDKLPDSQLPAKVAPMLKDLAPGKISEPIDTPKGRRFFAVCGRGAGNEDGLPAAEDIRRQMEDAQLELVARHYVLDLHANAIVDIRKP